MPVIEGLDPNLQWLLTTVFVVAVAVFTAWSHVTGKAAPKQKAAEFTMAGQLADMGPVKELVEQTGLLVQQQVRTNLAIEACVEQIARLVEAQLTEIEDRDREEEIERRARVRAEDLVREQEASRSTRRTTRKPTA
jgi:hypothetical protein